MVTTRRSSNNFNESYSAKGNSDVCLLERKLPKTYNEYIGAEQKQTEDINEARARMQRNLDKLLNYDRYAEEMKETPVVEQTAQETKAVSDDDIRPTSTTMQFGDEDVSVMYNEMKTEEKEETSYHLNKKGKLALFLYSFAITAILALIVLNTGILSVLTKQNAVQQAKLDSIVSEYSAVSTEITEKTSDSYVLNMASTYGMIAK